MLKMLLKKIPGHQGKLLKGLIHDYSKITCKIRERIKFLSCLSYTNQQGNQMVNVVKFFLRNSIYIKKEGQNKKSTILQFLIIYNQQKILKTLHERLMENILMERPGYDHLNPELDLKTVKSETSRNYTSGAKQWEVCSIACEAFLL